MDEPLAPLPDVPALAEPEAEPEPLSDPPALLRSDELVEPALPLRSIEDDPLAVDPLRCSSLLRYVPDPVVAEPVVDRVVEDEVDGEFVVALDVRAVEDVLVYNCFAWLLCSSSVGNIFLANACRSLSTPLAVLASRNSMTAFS